MTSWAGNMNTIQTIIAILSVQVTIAGCKVNWNASTKSAENSCSDSRERITQAETGLKGLNAKIPSDDPTTPEPPAMPITTGDCGDSSNPLKSKDCSHWQETAEAQNAKDIARFTADLTQARADLKVCLALQGEQKNQVAVKASCIEMGGRMEAEDNTCRCLDGRAITTGICEQVAASKTEACAAGQYRDSTNKCVSNGSDCKANFYMGEDGRCYPKAERQCTTSEYLAIDGKCYLLGAKTVGTKTSCPSGQVLTSLKNCVPDTTYSNIDGNYK
jgi:hypothetical protein